MKFLFAANTPREPNAGASGCDIATIEALRSQGHHVDEIWAEDMPRRIQHPNLHQWLELPRSFAKAVSSKCRETRFDVVQVNQPHAWLAARQHCIKNRPGVFLNRSHGWETALHQCLEQLHLADSRSKGKQYLSRLLRSRLERHNHQVVRWADGLVVCSTPDKEFILRHHRKPSDAIHVFAPGVPSDFVETPISQCSNRWRGVLHVSNFCKPKAPEIVAAVYRSVAELLPTTQLTWVCATKDHQSVRELLGSAAKNVTLKDFVARDELRAIMDNHGTFLFPSHFEGFGMVFLEAMARGMCVVGTPVGGMPGCIRSFDNGVIIDLNSAEQATFTVISLLKKTEELAAMGAQAARHVREFTWSTAASEFTQFCLALHRSKGRQDVSSN